MQNRYYYLVSSLPHLEFGTKPVISKQAFFAECGKWLSQKDLNLLQTADKDILENTPAQPEVLKEWGRADKSLREDLSIAREAKKRSSSEKPPEFAASIFDKENPLLMETEFERKRWAMLDELEFGCYFDVNILVIYLLKLKILERLGMFNKDEGIKAFDNACEVAYG